MPRPPLEVVIVGAVALSAVGVTPLVSFADEKPALAAVPIAAAQVKLDLAPGMAAAMRRDLELDDTDIADRLTTEAAAPVVEKRLRKQLGKAFGGAWIPAGASRLTVGVTTEANAAKVRAEGADVKIVKRSESSLAAARAKLNKNAEEAGPVPGHPVGLHHQRGSHSDRHLQRKPGSAVGAQRCRRPGETPGEQVLGHQGLERQRPGPASAVGVRRHRQPKVASRVTVSGDRWPCATAGGHPAGRATSRNRRSEVEPAAPGGGEGQKVMVMAVVAGSARKPQLQPPMPRLHRGLRLSSHHERSHTFNLMVSDADTQPSSSTGRARL